MRHPPTFLQRHCRPRAWLVSLALGMLVLMQSVGGVHAILHHKDTGSPAHAFDDTPFGLHAANSTDCQLLDQLSHADLAPLPAHPWTPTRVDTPCLVSAGTASVARQARSYRARDPPGLA